MEAAAFSCFMKISIAFPCAFAFAFMRLFAFAFIVASALASALVCAAVFAFDFASFLTWTFSLDSITIEVPSFEGTFFLQLFSVFAFSSQQSVFGRGTDVAQ